jgi:tartrate dehydrogenase/decarboxylase/D-malate dehydrogenase
MPFWDEVVAEVTAGYPSLTVDKRLIDALAAELVLRPFDFDVIVASNLYGDILSDLAAAIVGSLGIAASANLNPERRFPSMFEPVHGSAPDIAGLGVANPIAAVWSGALMLEHLGRERAAARIMRAIERTVADPRTRTRDLGGTASTQGVVDALLVQIAIESVSTRG